MRPLFAFLVLLALALPSLAAEQRDYPAKRVAPHTWVIHGPLGEPSVKNQGFMNNPGFVVTRDGVVVVDPGSSVQAGRMVLRQIRKVTDKPVTHVLNTHVHGDHWLGNQAILEAYPEVKILAHPRMIAEAEAGAGAFWVDLMERLTEGFTRGTRAVVPTIPVTEDQTLTIGGFTFKIHAPEKAHSNTDIMIEVVEERLVFLGDNVLAGRIGRMDDGTFAGSIAACERAERIPAKVFVPGHGKTGNRQIVTAYKDYLSTLLNAVKQGYAAGLADFEMKPAVVAKLARWQRWNGFADNVGRQISLAVLEVEAM